MKFFKSEMGLFFTKRSREFNFKAFSRLFYLEFLLNFRVQNFDQNFHEQNFDFGAEFRFSSKTSIFELNLDFRTAFWFLTKILILCRISKTNFIFGPIFPFSTKTFYSWRKAYSSWRWRSPNGICVLLTWWVSVKKDSSMLPRFGQNDKRCSIFGDTTPRVTRSRNL